MRYQDFLASKRIAVQPAGFEVDALPPDLFAFQRQIVQWACRQGRAALFCGCGLGKTFMQLAWADAVRRVDARPVLILTPLAVGPQTVAEAARFGISAVKWANSQDDVGPHDVAVTNYQKLLAGRFDPEQFGAVVLDESSILKNYMGKTKQALMTAFARTPFRLCCTATPAPNDHLELGNHAQFLGVMDSDEMIARWFIAEQGEGAGKYRLKGHGESDYWRWVASWAVCVDKPSDLGFSDEGFDLPALNYHQHVVGVNATVDAPAGQFWRSDSLTATSIHKEMRLTAESRAAKVAELVRSNREPWVVWCNTNYEEEAILQALGGSASTLCDVVNVRGDQSDEVKEDRLARFADGRARVIVSKPSICGFGLNWQHCRQTAFVGLSYSHEQFYQAVRRLWRFGQTRPVDCHVVIAETEGEVLAAIRRKEADGERMRAAMIRATREGQQMDEGKRPTLIQAPNDMATGRGWVMRLGDCVEATKDMQAESVDFTIFSPPFAGLYIYSDAEADMGNSADDAEFFRHFGYLVPQLLRITVPGRLCAVHCKDLPKYAGRDGIAGLKDYPGECIRLFESAGWSFHSRVTIWKCPVTERERTNNNGLLHKTVKRDSSQCRQGMADYLLVFRKYPREADGLMSARPIVRPGGLEEWKGNPAADPRRVDALPHPSRFARKVKADAMGEKASIAVWQRYADPVWWDIDQTDTLNERIARDNADEKHICPLQLGVIRRAVHLWSAPGDMVFSPFAGIGSEGYVALQEGRKFTGVELKRAYWERAQRNLVSAVSQPDLFAGHSDDAIGESVA